MANYLVQLTNLMGGQYKKLANSPILSYHYFFINCSVSLPTTNSCLRWVAVQPSVTF